MASGEQFFDQTGMDRGGAFAFSGGAHDVDSPDAEAAGDQASRVHPWPAALPPTQKTGNVRGDFHPELANFRTTGRVDGDDSAFAGNLSDDTSPGIGDYDG